jgi:hypothetical protein
MADNIKDLLYKFIAIKNTLGERKIVLIYAYDINIQNFIDLEEKKSEKTRYLIYFVDVLGTIENQQTRYITNLVSNVDEFISNISELSEEESSEYIYKCQDIVYNDLLEINKEAINFGKIISAIKYANSSLSNSTGSIIIGSNRQGVANVVYSAIEGEVNFSEEDIDKIAKVLNDVVLTYAISKIDLSKDENIKKLNAELKYKIIEVLPTNVKADDIDLNTNFIIKQIEDMQYHQFDENDEEEENNGNI